MPISQESLLLISMPNSAITVSQMHIPSKTHFQRAVGGVKKFFCGQCDIKLNYVLNSSAYMQIISSDSFSILWSKHFHLWQWSFDIVLFTESNVCTWPLRIRFSIVILCLRVFQRCHCEWFNDCHRQTPKPVVWTHRLAIAPQPKAEIFLSQEEVDGIDGIKTPYNHVKTETSAYKSIYHSFHAVLWTMDHTQKMTFQCI